MNRPFVTLACLLLSVPAVSLSVAALFLSVALSVATVSLSVAQPGTITTVAGNGRQGFSGDGGPATQASLNAPTGIAVDAKGNVYIADTDNNRVRRVRPNGIITTIAGIGAPLFSGDGGPSTQAGLSTPKGIAVDAQENIYIAEQPGIGGGASAGWDRTARSQPYGTS